ncbi:hypothetical protein HPB51_024629 [Rhipicephalus microplus]|uniref:PiggyBac transposable element-derived protein domain-containing protein n=1 Tax=Rhipicephalus microplus TaxID=6941 RepID=A0A9J6FAE8_RHIMP|nr:hypothetical protein HPB51_024629 [Rhipicephalus microplus]
MMKRPKKWGYKVWTLAGRSGYVYKFELYGDNLVSEPTGLQNTIGESGKIVVRFTEGCAGKEVFCNNFFASAELLAEMKLCGLGCTSTLRSGRTGRCPLQNEKELKGNGRGSSDFRREKENGLVICQWYDNRTVTIGSNKHSVNPVGSCRRCDRKNKSFLEVQRLSLVRVYNQSMGGVDRADQLPAFYRNDLKTKKWYKRVVFHLLDLAIVNSWLLYRATKGLSMQLADYKLQIPLGLMKAEQATEDAKEQRKLGSTRLSNRASDIPGAVSVKMTESASQAQCRDMNKWVNNRTGSVERYDPLTMSEVTTMAETPPQIPSVERARRNKTRKNKKRSSEHRKKERKRSSKYTR